MAYTVKVDSIEGDYVIFSSKSKGRWEPKRAQCDIASMEPGKYYAVELRGNDLVAWSLPPPRDDSKPAYPYSGTAVKSSGSGGAPAASQGVNWDMFWGSACNIAGHAVAAGKVGTGDDLVALINRLAEVRMKLGK